MKGRTKRIIDLAIRALFIFLSLVLTFVYDIVIQFSLGNDINLITDNTVELMLEGDAKATTYIEDGRLVVEITEQGTNYNDISVTLKIDNIEYDAAVFEEVLGDSEQSEYGEYYIDNLKNGPWLGTTHYQLTGDSVFVTGDDSYTFVDNEANEYSNRITSSAANQMNVSSDLTYQKGNSAVAKFVMGTEETGALPEGKYYISAKLLLKSGIVNEAGESATLPLDAGLSIFIKVFVDTLKETPFTEFFEISSLMTLYGMMTLFGFVFYMYNDLRAAFKIGAMVAKGSTVRTVVVNTYINGSLVDSHEKKESDGSLFMGIVAFWLSYMLFLLTVPIRMIITITKDIIHILGGDSNEEGFPLFGNIFGSIGVYAAIYCFINFKMSGLGTVAIISGIIAVVGLIVAGILCKKSDNYWQDLV